MAARRKGSEPYRVRVGFDVHSVVSLSNVRARNLARIEKIGRTLHLEGNLMGAMKAYEVVLREVGGIIRELRADVASYEDRVGASEQVLTRLESLRKELGKMVQEERESISAEADQYVTH